MKKRCLVAALVVLFLVQPASAQVELIVRPSGAAIPTFSRAVAQFPAKSSSLDPGLFDAVQSARHVFASAPQSAKSSPQAPYAFTLTVPDSSAYETLKARWARRPDIESVEPNAPFAVTTSSAWPVALSSRLNDPLADSLNHLQVIRARDAWEVTTGNESVRIGLIDTGLDLDHP